MLSLSGRILLPSADNVELFTSQGREIMMSFTENLFVDAPLDFVTPHLPGFTENEFWSRERTINRKPPASTGQPKSTRVRSFFLSDLHLGFRHSRVTYCNAGDWVKNCTAFIEGSDGELSLAWL